MREKRIKVPLWQGLGEDRERVMIVKDSGGKVVLIIKTLGEKDVKVKFEKGDFDKAWEVVRKFR